MNVDDIAFVTMIEIANNDFINPKLTMINLNTINYCYEDFEHKTSCVANVPKVERIPYTFIVTNGTSFKIKEKMEDFLPENLLNKMIAIQMKNKLTEK